MRRLLSCTFLTPALTAGFAAPLHAETVVTNARTTPIATATANNGAADAVRVSSAGSIKVNSGTAITMNSSHNVRNEGTLQISGANNANGILANAGLSGSITNTGTITIDENYTPTDGDKDGDLDGPFAQGSGRYGIRVGPGGTFAGSVTNSGTITIEGNQSAGIAVDSNLAGSLSHSGTMTVLGNDSVGIRAGNVTGDVRITGTTGVRGANSVGASLTGNIGGALVVQGAITATGYRTTEVPTDVSKLDADDLLQGGPALVVSGNVAKGILFDAPPKNNSETDTDEDDDGVADASEGTAAVTSYGSAAAVRIGSATTATTIGAVPGTANNGHGIVVNGAISGNGLYKNVAGNGMTIGGLGAAVNVAGGVSVNGSVTAQSNGGDATALKIGDKAVVQELRIAGTVGAAGGSTDASAVRAIAIDAGADTRTIRNGGKIQAALTGEKGIGTAILDKSGGLTLVENKGSIVVTGASAADKAVAIDTRLNTSGVTIRQLAVGASETAPAITGDVWLGSGNDLFDVADGIVTGTTRFGTGSDRLSLSGDAAYAGNVTFTGGGDALALAGTSTLIGNVDFGGGASTMTLGGTSRFTGALSNSGAVAVTVAGGGSLDVTNAGAVSLASVALGPNASFSVTIGEDGNTRYDVAGAASFGEGTKLNVRLDNVGDSEGSHVVVKAGSLAGGSNIQAAGVTLPFMFASSVSANPGAGEVKLDIRRKTSAELGLNGSETRAYAAVYDALDNDEQVADAFLAIPDGEMFRASMQQMLPEHAGGIFESVTQGSRATARHLFDPLSPIADMGGWGFWVQQVGWGTSKDLGDTSAYDVSGWGASGGAEVKTGVGSFGVSLAYLLGKDAEGASDNEIQAGQYEGAVYWHGSWGGLHAHARVSAARVGFEGTRRFAGSAGATAVVRTAVGEWNGTLLSASGGLSWEKRLGRFSLRPIAAIDYYSLDEGGYTETGGGNAFNLIVDGRKSDELAASGSLTVGYDFGSLKPENGYFRVELEGGRRQLVGGSIGDTIAHFEDGDDFTLISEERKSGWLGRLRILGGNELMQFGGEFSAEEQQGHAAIAFRATLKIDL